MISEISGGMPSIQMTGMRARPEKNDGGGFKELDSDSNGSINFEEFSKLKEKGGELSAEELQKKFANVDSDGNGEVTESEMAAARERRDAGGPKPPAGANKEFMQQLRTAVESNDETSIKSLLEQLKSSKATYSASSTGTSSATASETTSLVLDIQA